jgi:putative transposase
MIAERQWEQKGFFLRLWQAGLQMYDELEGIQWEWQAVDGAMTKAPLGKSATGANPTDRGKKGTRRSLLTDGAGIPLAMVIDGANRHDVKLLCATLDGIVIARSEPTEERPQHLCLDAGYDGAPAYQEVETRHYVPHIRSRGEEKQEKVLTPGYRARRWVVERTHSWINRSRRLLVRSREKRGALPRFPSPCLCSIDLCQNPGFRISSYCEWLRKEGRAKRG